MPSASVVDSQVVARDRGGNGHCAIAVIGDAV
jgi:hypothetical protein